MAQQTDLSFWESQTFTAVGDASRFLAEYVELCDCSLNPDIETFLITDEANGHYIWMNPGWQSGKRITGMTVYL
ncbi:MAG: hypothetical protein HC866_16515 [Leptolyngbyaceae cyanobacterium RU_5_1]|nr:hypothetical protein [Leptolyngbyaceae cyanobacterium RU_5_1]